MKISLSWLKTFITLDRSAEEIASILTGVGLEVEGVEKTESYPGGLKGLVVGKVLECEKHPDADRLRVTKVDIGNGGPLSIVCGAPNVSVGQKVIVATPGAKLFPVSGEPFEIKKSKIRGVASEGMICAEDEIGIGKSHEGIMVLPEEIPAGMPAADFFKVESDAVFEIGLTPNRNDAASHLGVARDLVAALNSSLHKNEFELKLPGEFDLPESRNGIKVDIEIRESAGCKRYSGIVISGVTVKESPDWIKNRLKAIGLRPLNNIVDITNFVLHELGQPLHAFDTQKISGNRIIVRTAKEGEKFRTLDEVERSLKEGDLLICNEKEPMCIAGVFGGAVSGVTESTTSVFIESAYFDPGHIRSAARHHGLKTDASFRFERGTDPQMTVMALKRAASLILEIAGGYVDMDIVDVYPEPMLPYKVAFSYVNCKALIGKDIDHAHIKTILLQLGMEIESEGTDGLLLKVPRYRHDVTREADVIEEVMRIYGYDNVEVSKHISWTIFDAGKNHNLILEDRIAALLTGFGFNEMMNLSLSSSAKYPETEATVKVLNPLSNDLNVLRADMVFSGLETIAYNVNRKNADLKLFEFGKTYHPVEKQDEKYKEKKYLTLFVTGAAFKENPYGLKQDADFPFLKSALLALFAKAGITNYKSTESSYAGFEYGLSYLYNNTELASLGSINRSYLKNADIRQPVYYASIHWDTLVKAFEKQKVTFEEVSKFPSVRRDLALLIDKSVKYQQIEEMAFASERKILQEVNLFDIYENEKLGNKRSYAVSFTLLDKEATLTDKQIDAVMDKLIKNYREKLGAELR
jgi:phenylalanyl-tRNA synthetase beta chain